MKKNKENNTDNKEIKKKEKNTGSKDTKKKGKAKIVVPICIFAVLAAAYIAGIVVFSIHMMPHSYISNYTGEHDVSFAKADVLSEILAQNDALVVTVSRDDGRELSFTLSEVKDDNAKETSAQELLDAQPVFAWPASFFNGKHVYNNSSYGVDSSKVQTKIEESEICTGEASKDAYIDADEDGVYDIVPEFYGTEVDPEVMQKELMSKLANGIMTLNVTGDMYIKPEITQEDEGLQARLAKIKEMTDREIVIDMYLAEEVIRCGDFFDEEKILNEDVYEVSEAKVDEYMQYLSDTYETFETKRNFVTHAGKKIKVGAQKDLADDTYGFSMNKEETRRVIISAINDPEVPWIYALWNMVGNARDEENGDIGHTYIEISIDEQKLWYYVDGEVVFEANVVTGLPTEKRHTPKGVFSMFWKDTDTRLNDSLDDEHWDVKVDYWLSLTYTGVGIHSAPWQPGFGGDLYLSNGSHGCVNVSTEDAKYLYDNIEEGTCVVIY